MSPSGLEAESDHPPEPVTDPNLSPHARFLQWATAKDVDTLTAVGLLDKVANQAEPPAYFAISLPLREVEVYETRGQVVIFDRSKPALHWHASKDTVDALVAEIGSKQDRTQNRADRLGLIGKLSDVREDTAEDGAAQVRAVLEIEAGQVFRVPEPPDL